MRIAVLALDLGLVVVALEVVALGAPGQEGGRLDGRVGLESDLGISVFHVDPDLLRGGKFRVLEQLQVGPGLLGLGAERGGVELRRAGVFQAAVQRLVVGQIHADHLRQGEHGLLQQQPASRLALLREIDLHLQRRDVAALEMARVEKGPARLHRRLAAGDEIVHQPRLCAGSERAGERLPHLKVHIDQRLAVIEERLLAREAGQAKLWQRGLAVERLLDLDVEDERRGNGLRVDAGIEDRVQLDRAPLGVEELGRGRLQLRIVLQRDREALAQIQRARHGGVGAEDGRQK